MRCSVRAATASALLASERILVALTRVWDRESRGPCRAGARVPVPERGPHPASIDPFHREPHGDVLLIGHESRSGTRARTRAGTIRAPSVFKRTCNCY